jgi:hypothetical protein
MAPSRAPAAHPPRRLVVQPLGGLANRLRVVASAAIAAAAGGRELRLRWTIDGACGADWSELFENPIARADGAPSAEARRYDRGPVNFAVPGPGDAADDPEPVVEIATFFQFKPRAMPMASFLAAKAAFYRSLTPVAPVRRALEELIAREFAGRPVVGVHIRRTDLVLAGTPPAVISPTARFLRRMRERVAAEPATRFFLATDDREEEERLAATFPGRVFTHPKRSLDRARVEALQDALVDWLALGRCDRILRSAGTSFSREAALAGGVPRETIRRPLWPYDRPRFWLEALRRRLAVVRRRLGARRAAT